MMRPFLACVLAVSVLGSVAHAQAKDQKRPQAVRTQSAPPVSKNPCADPYAVCWAGNYIGRDPDPRVRAQLLWDFQAGLPND
jgi:hypothetical protein